MLIDFKFYAMMNLSFTNTTTLEREIVNHYSADCSVISCGCFVNKLLLASLLNLNFN